MTSQAEHDWLTTISLEEAAREVIPDADSGAVTAYLNAINLRPTWTMTHTGVDTVPTHGTTLRVLAAIADARADDAPSPQIRNLGAYVRTIREVRRQSREELAHRARIDPIALALIEHGLLTDQEACDALISRVAVGLDMPVSQLHFVMAPSAHDAPEASSHQSLWERLWNHIEPLLEPVPAFLSRAALLGGDPVDVDPDAPAWIAGLRDKVIDDVVPLPTFVVMRPPTDDVIDVIPELLPTGDLDGSDAHLRLHFLISGTPVTGLPVQLSLDRIHPDMTHHAVTDGYGVVEFARVDVRHLLSAISTTGDWPLAVAA